MDSASGAVTSALTKKKVKKLIKKEVAKQIANATGPPGPRGADGTDGADGADGANGADGADGTARAYAWVHPHTAPPCTGGSAGNECAFERSKGVTRVTRPNTGVYCVTAPGINSANQVAAATVEWGNTTGPEGDASAMVRATALNCGPGEFEVHTDRQPNITVDQGGGNNNAAAVGPSVEADNVGFTIVIP